MKQLQVQKKGLGCRVWDLGLSVCRANGPILGAAGQGGARSSGVGCGFQLQVPGGR